MASEPEPVPVSSQKHDPAWKHCQMFRNGDRYRLKCIYCGKMFSGGGIHRIKEHLAGQKGNAATCLNVQPEVRQLMQQSLDGGVLKRKKKLKIAEEKTDASPSPLLLEGTTTPAPPNELDTFATPGEATSGFQLITAPAPDTVEQNSGLLANREEEMGQVTDRSTDKRKRGRMENFSPPPVLPDAPPIGSNLTIGPGKGKEHVNLAIGRFLYDIGAPLDAVNSVYFQPMIEAILSEGQGLKPPSYHDLRGWILKNSVEEVKSIVDQYKGSWVRTGCSVLADELMTESGRSVINFFVYCPEGLMFLKSVDASDILSSTDALYELLKEVVEEVGVQNVLQVITDSSEHYVVAGKKLTETYPTMYWTPCSARCVDLMLKDISEFEWINTTFEHSKSITRFIYNHPVVLNMMRRYTYGKDLVQPAITRSATNFTTLQSMVSLKNNLQTMVTSQEWMDCPHSKTSDGLVMIDVICSESFWNSCISIIRLTDPLLRVLRMVTSEKRPAMGYIYEAMYRAKQVIKKELVKKKDYVVYWNVIDQRWNQQLSRPLHAAGFYLNPSFFYGIEGDVHNEIMSGMLDCIERLVPEIKTQDKITKELSSYKNAAGDFGRKMSIRARNTLPPVEWWSTYGGGCPNLSRLAIRILSQTCSAFGINRNQSSFKQINRTRNSLEHQRFNDLLFVQYNLRFKQMQLRRNKEADAMDPISIDNIDVVEDWVAEKEILLGEYVNSDWTSLVQPVANVMQSLSPNNEDEGMVEGYGDDEIYDGVNDDDVEEEDVQIQCQQEGYSDGNLEGQT
ncbi:PREDICTED: uncharacterized protein LOC104597134 [Nelumbo nucifera]|uniref:BED-type domain-containing protein n=2 Tax=Nelumbo nucifera TaxID=4432 RepID=A0A822Y207_NELNU|nr:PREDICTED: uncharacterized protein LOC104597134 [Nelumbo nucifera]DAD26487.1 TPA_asm: hypothetical protein HUJ06_027955 [Nelumbo nucifera]